MKFIASLNQRSLIGGLLILACLSDAAHAQIVPEPKPKFTGVEIQQRLDAQVPADLKFYNESGREVLLGDYFGDKPIVLNLVYYQCPQLCGEVLHGLLTSIQAIPLQLEKDYEILTVSFDPDETYSLAAEKKRRYVEKYARSGAEEGWHFLTGPAGSSKQLADAVGFSYEYDPRTDQYAHASGIMVLTPDGKVSKYLYGIEYHPRDLRLALVESSQGKIGTPVDQFLLLCFHYDPLSGRYGLAISFVLKASGILTVLVLGIFVVRSLRQERRAQHELVTAGTDNSTTDFR